MTIKDQETSSKSSIEISLETIEKIAHLAKLKITPSEAVDYQQQLSKVLTHFNQISMIDTTNIEPLVTPAAIEFVGRADVAQKDFTAEELLATAPDKMGHLLKVPPVV